MRTSKSSVAEPCFLPCRAKGLSALCKKPADRRFSAVIYFSVAVYKLGT